MKIEYDVKIPVREKRGGETFASKVRKIVDGFIATGKDNMCVEFDESDLTDKESAGKRFVQTVHRDYKDANIKASERNDKVYVWHIKEDR